MSNGDLKRWAETRHRAGSALARVHRRELEAMTDDDVRHAVSDLFSGGVPADLPPRTTSGLIEPQRLFKLLHRRA